MPTTPTTRPATATAQAAAPDEVQAVLAAIAKSHLDLDTLESRHQDRLDFHEHACTAIRDALRAAFEAGTAAAAGRRALKKKPLVAPEVIDGDIVITSPKPKPGCGDWVRGRIGGYRFCALVFPEHAQQADFELGRSRISKLELRRLDTNAVVFNWDRGLDVPAKEAGAKAAVERLGKHLANHCFGWIPA